MRIEDLKGLFTASSYMEQARQIIKRLILDGTYQPGERVKEAEIAEALGISRSPVREAVMNLANEGLIKLHPQRGAFVRDFDLREIRELYEVRRIMEGQAVRLAAERAGKEGLAKIEKLLEDMERVLEETEAHPNGRSNRTLTYPFPADFDFHTEICKLSGNQRLTQYIEEINTQLRLARTRSTDRPGRARKAHGQHLAVYEAIKSADAEKAGEAMELHLGGALLGVEERFGGKEVQ